MHFRMFNVSLTSNKSRCRASSVTVDTVSSTGLVHLLTIILVTEGYQLIKNAE